MPAALWRRLWSRPVAQFIAVHVQSQFDRAGKAVNPASGPEPVIPAIDTVSRTDNYLLGYLTGWCEVIERQAPAIDSLERYAMFQLMVMARLFGQENAAAIMKTIAENVLTEKFQTGIRPRSHS